MKKILIASDHAGFQLKTAVIKQLSDCEWEDLGPSSNEKVDYPDYAALVAERISAGEAEWGILICGSGIGMSIAANKFPHVRAAHAENPLSAELSREHNNSNILCLGARFLAPEYASAIVWTWLNTAYTQDPRHQNRIDKIETLEQKLSKTKKH